MRTINLRQGLMLASVGIMVLMLITVLGRMLVWVLVDKAHIDNSFTQTVLIGTDKGVPLKDRNSLHEYKMDWSRKYPFADIENTSEETLKSHVIFLGEWKDEPWIVGNIKRIVAWPLGKLNRLASISKRKTESAVQIFDKRLLGYNKLVEVGRTYEESVNWHFMNPERRVISLGEGIWHVTYSYRPQEEHVQSLYEFAKWCQQNGRSFFYVQAPCKADKYGDFEVNGKLDFSNQNANELIKGLKDRGVDVIDLRDYLHEWSKKDNMDYHDFFYRTDGHWRPETAIRASRVLADKLKTYGMPVDDSQLRVDFFNVEVLPDFFLGSEGKRVSLAKTKPENFSILSPKFPTKIRFSIPSLNIDEVGDFSVTFNKYQIRQRDYYGRDPYAMYGYSNKPVEYLDNLLLPYTDKKVLFIRDSFSASMVPFLALGVKNIAMICLMTFSGSIQAFIEEYNPDIVIVEYHPGWISKQTNWESHLDPFDFR